MANKKDKGAKALENKGGVIVNNYDETLENLTFDESDVVTSRKFPLIGKNNLRMIAVNVIEFDKKDGTGSCWILKISATITIDELNTSYSDVVGQSFIESLTITKEGYVNPKSIVLSPVPNSFVKSEKVVKSAEIAHAVRNMLDRCGYTNIPYKKYVKKTEKLDQNNNVEQKSQPQSISKEEKDV